MDLDTFLTTLYVLVDDWYKGKLEEQMQRRRGGKQQMNDSEVLAVALAGQWRAGVPWQSERGVVRYMQKHGRQWFPKMLGRSAFNERVRLLWGAFVQLQQQAADLLRLADELYESVDCVPVPHCSLAHAAQAGNHGLVGSSLGRGGNQGGWFFGYQLLAVVTPRGVVTGWLLGTAKVDDRWMLEALLSARAGQAQLQGPPPHPRAAHGQRFTPPLDAHFHGLAATGKSSQRLYLADRGFNGARWQQHWQTTYAATVITVPPANAPSPWSRPWRYWLSQRRQIVETLFARLTQAFAFKQLRARSTWGQLTRIAATMAAYNIGIFLNRSLGRPDGALATLLC